MPFSACASDVPLVSDGPRTLLAVSEKWINEFIEWDPDRFCSINKILLSKETLWKPDLYIYERIEDEDNSPVVPFYSLKYNGEIKVSFPLRIVSSCNLNVYKFPFDIQRCNLTFGSYIHSVQDIIMVTNASATEVFNASLKLFVSKGDWGLKNIIVRPRTVVSGNVKYSAIYYEITLQRMAIFYIITLIVPAYVLVILDIFNVNNRALEEQVLETKRKPERDKEDSMEVQMLKMLLLQVKKIHKNIVDSEAMNEVKTEWHAAAIVVDRLILIIYLCIVVILFIYVIIIWYT
ncbi:unnamed protein product [Ranitomeya imitator]|uniref:Neurotransmitter-gated ion-channel ligand-binding domain-containing protein n=1 Tax=Ranitomeya imitator TaxID=111125 RepID=A0ABN9LDZ1_9NEOB|nr:unnamed protein product [Ranitomeya imitator]